MEILALHGFVYAPISSHYSFAKRSVSTGELEFVVEIQDWPQPALSPERRRELADQLRARAGDGDIERIEDPSPNSAITGVVSDGYDRIYVFADAEAASQQIGDRWLIDVFDLRGRRIVATLSDKGPWPAAWENRVYYLTGSPQRPRVEVYEVRLLHAS